MYGPVAGSGVADESFTGLFAGLPSLGADVGGSITLFFATGLCPEKNTDIVSDVVFVLGWPVYLYDDVVHGTLTPPQWLHRQACEGGLRTLQKT